MDVASKNAVSGRTPGRNTKRGRAGHDLAGCCKSSCVRGTAETPVRSPLEKEHAFERTGVPAPAPPFRAREILKPSLGQFHWGVARHGTSRAFSSRKLQLLTQITVNEVRHGGLGSEQSLICEVHCPGRTECIKSNQVGSSKADKTNYQIPNPGRSCFANSNHIQMPRVSVHGGLHQLRFFCFQPWRSALAFRRSSDPTSPTRQAIPKRKRKQKRTRTCQRLITKISNMDPLKATCSIFGKPNPISLLRFFSIPTAVDSRAETNGTGYRLA